MAVEFYKPDGARASRGLTALSLGTLLLYGVSSLHDELAEGWWMTPFQGFGEILGEEFPLAPRTFVAVAMILAVGAFVHWLCNYAKYVDFLIETEAELKKVTWASWAEVQSSSIIVVIVTVVFAIYTFSVDSVFGFIKKNVDIVQWFG